MNIKCKDCDTTFENHGVKMMTTCDACFVGSITPSILTAHIEDVTKSMAANVKEVEDYQALHGSGRTINHPTKLPTLDESPNVNNIFEPGPVVRDNITRAIHDAVLFGTGVLAGPDDYHRRDK